MAEIINLRQARKAKARAADSAAADANRLAFGRTKAERQGTAARNEKAERDLEAHRRETPRDDA